MIREAILAASLITGSNYADAVSTQHAVRAGGVEGGNPFLYGRHGERVVPMKFAVSALETGVFIGLHKHHKKSAWALVAVIVLANGYAYHHNEKLARQLSK